MADAAVRAVWPAVPRGPCGRWRRVGYWAWARRRLRGVFGWA
ncbi:hypothetical protein COLSTE_00050 [Collinsella stercoris DSM 13279]|uniref:Uncharacterized protein n=1 Tax=Collinsella stercoris DSM 13279 TaxID=445975 RepID=B6G7L1_9ACTN|nr:hypothetical protein COLSTE_00050 [Collinsella stercoris DSM 13279]